MHYKIIIYDDDEVLRNSLEKLLNLEKDFEVVAQKSNPLQVVEDIICFEPNIVLMDIEMPAMNGVQGVSAIRKVYADLPIIMLTNFENNENIYDALCAGANGYLLKTTHPLELANAVRDVLNGGAPITSSIAKKVLQIFAHKPTIKNEANNVLTAREIQMLQLMTQGKSYKMIANELGIAVETVRTHIKNVYKKIQVNNATGAVAYAINQKLV
jgi:DNA-binding NarL/FixJ family response regulator